MTDPLQRPLPRRPDDQPRDNQPAGPQGPRRPAAVFWDRRELDAILSVYGRRVAAGDWRDYAMSGLKDRAVFAIYRRASEMPLYRIEKTPKLRNRQGAYSVISATGMVLKRGHELRQVLKVLEPKTRLTVVS